ncbi:hypothetical protein [Cryobacterium lyxosi]|uniref:Uncharacterized protein n=1 Tax=Cryobacterium lyxosi TaxID=1259228 RepID=A0A4R8ZFV0_9MICO|nr:hypothetical protein [Cryobacterium lyxosi]TFD26628.1 hypothetical protein E3T27_07605 [Cryobacterium lyxosi]
MTIITSPTTSQEFDRRGFNTDGIHRVTETIFNTRVRTREGESPRQYGERIATEQGLSPTDSRWKVAIASVALRAGLRRGYAIHVWQEKEGDYLKLRVTGNSLPLEMSLWVGDGEEPLIGTPPVRLIPTIESFVQDFTRQRVR